MVDRAEYMDVGGYPVFLICHSVVQVLNRLQLCGYYKCDALMSTGFLYRVAIILVAIFKLYQQA